MGHDLRHHLLRRPVGLVARETVRCVRGRQILLLRSIGSPPQPDFCHRYAGHSQPSIAVDVCGRCGHGTDERNLGRLDLSWLWGIVAHERAVTPGFVVFHLLWHKYDGT